MFKRAAQYVKEKTEGKSTDSDTPTAPEASPVVADIEVKDATVDEPAPRREKSEKKGVRTDFLSFANLLSRKRRVGTRRTSMI